MLDAVKHCIVRCYDEPQQQQPSEPNDSSFEPHAGPMPVAAEPNTQKFCEAVVARFRSAEAAWTEFLRLDNEQGSSISRRGFRSVCTHLELALTNKQRGQLRKSMDPDNTKTVVFEHFAAVVGDSFGGLGSTASAEAERVALPPLPMDVPELVCAHFTAWFYPHPQSVTFILYGVLKWLL